MGSLFYTLISAKYFIAKCGFLDAKAELVKLSELVFIDLYFAKIA